MSYVGLNGEVVKQFSMCSLGLEFSNLTSFLTDCRLFEHVQLTDMIEGVKINERPPQSSGD